jgi:CheY-like chemotaxis protein
VQVATAETCRAATGETILLCEDDAIAREVIGEVLEEAGYRVVSVAGPGEALAARERDVAIDLLVSDVVLPGMSGLRLAEALRAREPGLRVLFMSGYTEQMIADRSGLAFGEELLRKPFGNASLLVKVRELLDAGGA